MFNIRVEYEKNPTFPAFMMQNGGMLCFCNALFFFGWAIFDFSTELQLMVMETFSPHLLPHPSSNRLETMQDILSWSEHMHVSLDFNSDMLDKVITHCHFRHFLNLNSIWRKELNFY